MTSAKILSHDDVAKRTEASIVRAMKILMDVRQQDGDLYEAVRHSRFLTNAGDLLAAELKQWGFDHERGNEWPAATSTPDTGSASTAIQEPAPPRAADAVHRTPGH